MNLTEELDYPHDNSEGGCSCHLNPPCGYCTDRHDCRTCGEQFYDPDGDFDICERCYNQKLGEE